MIGAFAAARLPVLANLPVARSRREPPGFLLLGGAGVGVWTTPPTSPCPPRREADDAVAESAASWA